MNFLELASERYSVRKYTEEPVSKEDMDYVLEAARLAPTAVNLQPQRIYVVQSEETLSKLNHLVPTTYGAGTVLVFSYDETEQWVNAFEPEIRSGVEDVSIVATHAMLAAAERGLGTCWINYFPNSMLERILGLPENERIVVVMPIGYPADNSHPTSMHRNSKAMEEIVHYL